MITDDIQEAIKRLNQNDVVAIPTETVYGLAARIDSEQAIKKIFTTKERPLFDPLIVHVKDAGQAKEYCKEWPAIYDRLAQKFWPGPLTLIAPKNDNVHDLITAGLPSVGLRCPAHPMTAKLLQGLSAPLAAPSANKFKHTSPTLAQHVAQEFGESLLVLDGGECQVGIESTIVHYQDNELLIYRPGMISKEELEEVTGLKVSYKQSPVAPGQLEQHYMPSIPLVLAKNLGQLEKLYHRHQLDLNKAKELKLSQDSSIAARELYQRLRGPQTGSLYFIYHEIPNKEQWAGVWDRLSKAAHYKDF